jgi:hypothetical protein
MKSYTWNPVFNKVIEIKNEYQKKFGFVNYDIYVYTDENGIKQEITCLERWVIDLAISEYTTLIEPLQINQRNNLLLIRYGRYSDVFGGENEITNENFWDIKNGFYKECRSIVIDIKNENIVLSPFKKFRNLNEGEENKLEVIIKEMNKAKSLEFTNKLDGSMQSARFYNNEIVMSGSQSINMNNSWRLQDGYNMLIKQNNYISMMKENSDYTFIFEYITLKDAHVVNYKKEDEGLYLLGLRNVYTGEQLSYRQVKLYADKYNVKMTQIFNKTFEEVIEDTKKYKSDEMEGFVMNIDGHLVKIKCDDYVQIHKVLSNISSINLIIKHIADNTFDDLISKVPESYKWRVIKIANLVFDYIKNTDVEVNNYFSQAPKNDKKDFMIWIDNNVPKEIRGYVRSKYLNKEFNYIKGGNEKSPSYKKLKDMGIDENYSTIFISEE